MRTQFDRQLEHLHQELTEMGKLCERAISDAIAALLQRDAALIQSVLSTDAQIDQKERDIEAICLRLLLQQQPVAGDLRAISSALKMISDMERIGDQAADIAEIARFIQTTEPTGKVHIRDMADAAIGMVTDSVAAFVGQDLALAHAVVAEDDTVDAFFLRIKKELIALIAQFPERGEYCIDLLMIAKYLERIGDHAENIAQWVMFSLTGRHDGDVPEAAGQTP